LFLSTRQTLNMLVRAQRNAIGDEERDKQLADTAWDLAKTGPFNIVIPVDAGSERDPRPLRDVLEAAGIDDARKNRLVILDPRRFSLLNGIDEETRAAIRAALGLGDDRLAVGWASSAIFAVVTTQLRANARKLTVEYLARQRVADIDAVRADEDLARKAREDLKEARKYFEDAIRDAYQHVIYLGEDTQGNRTDKVIRLDKKGQSSLNGDTVWAALCDADKAFARSEFDAQALLHNLRDSDYGRPLSEIRDSFWNTPRLPLLPDGEEDLRRAIYQAIRNGDLILVDHVGSQRTAETPADINMSSAGLRLAKPGTTHVEEAAVPNVVGRPADQARSVLSSSGFTADGATSGTITAQQPAGGELAPVGSAVMLFAETAPGPGPEEPDYLISVTLNTSLRDEERGYQVRMLLAALAEAADGDAAHIQMTVRITAPRQARDRIIERAKQAGAQQATSSEL
jgi:PASTA domain-containing protein